MCLNNEVIESNITLLNSVLKLIKESNIEIPIIDIEYKEVIIYWPKHRIYVSFFNEICLVIKWMTHYESAAPEDICNVIKNNIQNTVLEFDNRCFLYEDGQAILKDGSIIDCNHTYVVDGEIGYTSSTTFLGKYFEHFDGPAVAANMVKKPTWNKSKYFNEAERYAASKNPPDNTSRSKYWEEYLITTWSQAAPKGTDMHANIENFLLGRPYSTEGPEIEQFMNFYRVWLPQHNLKFFRAELRIFDKELKICGSIDALFRNPAGELVQVDWKRSQKIYKYGFGRRCRAPINHLADCNWNKYCLQQSLYKYIIEKNTDLKIKQMYLVIIHPSLPSYQVMEVPYMEQELRGLIPPPITPASLPICN